MLRKLLKRCTPFVAALAAACGSSSTTPSTSGGGGTTVTLAIKSGDAQQALPGAAVAVNPVVTATNKSGQPVAGLAIRFSVDSGAGGIATAQATTASDGTASPGVWTLGSGEGPNVLSASATGATAIRIHATALLPTTPLLSATAVPASGGTVRVTAAGNPLDGLTITVPDTAYASGTQLSIASKATTVTALPTGYRQVGPAIVITNAQGLATQPMALTIPVSVQSPDTALTAFLFDPSSGTLEMLPTVGRSGGTLRVMSRHFTADLLMKPAAAPATSAMVDPRVSRSSSTAAATASSYSPIQVIVVAAPAAQLNAATATGFTPGKDDWEFTNFGTVVKPDGICSGMSVSEMYYYYTFRKSGQLNGRYNTISGTQYADYTNAVGLRLATVAQRTSDFQTLNSYALTAKLYALASGISAAQLHYQTLVMAMQVTHLPQYLAIDGVNVAHAVVAFASANGQVSFADPNAPGTTRTMTFANGAFVPFPFSEVSGGNTTPITEVETIGASAILSAAASASQWAKVPDESIGKDIFPALTTEQYDEGVNNTWKAIDGLTGPLVTAATPLVLRTQCHNDLNFCVGVGTVDFPDIEPTILIDQSGRILGSDEQIFQTVAGAITTLPAGTTKVGILQKPGTATRTGKKVFKWGNFRWLSVQYVPVVLTFSPATPKPKDVVTLSVAASALTALTAKFVWDFGDGAPLINTTTGTTTHTYTLNASSTATVKLFNGDNLLIGTGQVLIPVGGAATTYSAWKLTANAGISVDNPEPADASNGVLIAARAAYSALKTYWTTPTSGIAIPTLWFVPTTANIGGDGFATGLFISDSIPGTGAAGGEPAIFPVASAGSVGQPFGGDDPALAPTWSYSGTDVGKGTLNASSPNGYIMHQYVPGYPVTEFVCLGDAPFRSTYVSYTVNFTMSDTIGSGTIDYLFRDVKPSCNRPNELKSSWHLIVPFSATRVR